MGGKNFDGKVSKLWFVKPKNEKKWLLLVLLCLMQQAYVQNALVLL